MATPIESTEAKPRVDYAKAVQKIVSSLVLVLTALATLLLDSISSLWIAFAPRGWIRYKDVRGKTVLITGAGNGLGRGLSERFSRRGCRLALWDMDEKGLEETRRLCEENGTKVITAIVDVTNREAITAAVKEITKEFGRVDILVNNAGIGTGAKLVDMEDNAIRKIIEVNTLSHFWVTKEVLPGMIADNSGHIVSVASMAGITAAGPDMIAYSVSKFGAVAFQEGLEHEMSYLGKDGIRFTTICPTFFHSNILQHLRHKPRGIMSLEYVVDMSEDAILRDMPLLILPRFAYLIYILKSILPRKTFVRCMAAYVSGNKKKD